MRGLAIDPVNRFLFFATDTDLIKRSLDGPAEESIVTGLDDSFHVVLDVPRKWEWHVLY